MSHLGGFEIFSPIRVPRYTVERIMTTVSIAANASTLYFWTLLMAVSIDTVRSPTGICFCT